MDEQQDLEEEIDILEYAWDNLDNVITMLKSISSNEYSATISQAQELLNNIDYTLIDKQEQLDEFNKQQLQELRWERYEREIEYKNLKGF